MGDASPSAWQMAPEPLITLSQYLAIKSLQTQEEQLYPPRLPFSPTQLGPIISVMWILEKNHFKLLPFLSALEKESAKEYESRKGYPHHHGLPPP